MSTRTPPKGLKAEGRRLWREVTGSYELSPTETESLAQACRVTDLLTRIEAELAGADLCVVGSTGQPRANPLLASAAEQRRVLDALFRSLALPMPDESTGSRRSPAAVAAAQARWRQGRASG